MDCKKPLIPSHLVIGQRLLIIWAMSAIPRMKTLTKWVKHLSSVFNHFWKRWRSEYLTSSESATTTQQRNLQLTLTFAQEMLLYNTSPWWHSTMLATETRTNQRGSNWTWQAPLSCPCESCFKISSACLFEKTNQLLYLLEICETEVPGTD